MTTGEAASNPFCPTSCAQPLLWINVWKSYFTTISSQGHESFSCFWTSICHHPSLINSKEHKVRLPLAYPLTYPHLQLRQCSQAHNSLKRTPLLLERTYCEEGIGVGGRKPRLVTWVQILFTSSVLGQLIFLIGQMWCLLDLEYMRKFFGNPKAIYTLVYL